LGAWATKTHRPGPSAAATRGKKQPASTRRLLTSRLHSASGSSAKSKTSIPQKARTAGRQALAVKNSLAAADARLVEESFRVQMRFLEPMIRQRQPHRCRQLNQTNVTQDGATSASGQNSFQIRVYSPVFDLWTPTLGSSSCSDRAATRAGPQGQRRVHRSVVPQPSSRTSPRQRRSRVVEASRRRCSRGRSQPLARNAPRPSGCGRSQLQKRDPG
jgi:hypothetical protein